ncbi:DNA polymerase III subunit gamma and tau [Streptomyces albidocamelliae]|uniref:DNA polymerase III subunit gamma/tau n=1 Tax=Streptomyces albidocamelliae TaxID=2981135 RepID=A0ABY6EQG2_9ACTN|nr:DNA polymerase III subunit gamma and tau [Streptomyces sp. HUAS 14-6]UXY36631.1 DNA polymerase III subunit gamma and tau [Streptomyces sp. HUAS 14-6]
MSSLALYRRYRPETFAEVIGQEHVTDPLQQALRNNRVNHAYLFSGPRGCGKTTSARILARCLNCEQGPTPTPCGECQSCQDLARNGPGSIDVIEIDAASHGGVDDARELREKAFFGPAASRYKIYIIDEAHMVTSAGFNALLKVVEEPPEHLKFIFATTEPEKVIGTIRSRTHHYPFRLVPPGTLRDYLGEVCGREDIPVEEGVLPLVVRAGAGSVRDSMSVMDQLLAGAAAEGVTYAMATSLLGYTDGSLLDSVVEAFATGDGAAAFEVVDRVIEGGNDPRRFVADLLERLRDLVILAAVPDAVEKGLIDAPADVLERMQAQASTFGAAELSRAADLVNEGLTEMRGATSPRLQLELICARVLLPAAYGDERSLMARLDRLERGVAFSGGAGAPAMGYVPGPEAHGGGAPVPSGGAPVPPAAARPRHARRSGAPAAPGTAPPPLLRQPPRLRPPHLPPPPPSRPLPRPRPRTPRLPRPPPRPRHRPCPPPPRRPPHRAPGPPPPPPAAGGAPAAGPRRPRRAATGRTRLPPGPRRRPSRGTSRPPRRRHRRPRRPPPRRPRPAVSTPGPLAEHPGGRQEPPPLHLDPAQPERPGHRLRRHHPPGRLRQRRRPRQLREQRQRGRAAPGAERAVRRAVEDRGGRRPVRRRLRPGARRSVGLRRRRWLRRRPHRRRWLRRPGRPRPAAPQPSAPQPSATPQSGPSGTAAASRPSPRPAAAPEPPPVSLEDDIPEDDDPDLDESALSGHELIVRELGATVMEEFSNE